MVKNGVICHGHSSLKYLHFLQVDNAVDLLEEC